MPQQQEKQLNLLLACLLATRKRLLIILLFPLILAGVLIYNVILAGGIVLGLIFFIFFLGPLVYFRGTILNSHALLVKYATQGIRLQGRVVKRWKTGEEDEHGPTYHVQAVYRVEENRYKMALIVPAQLFEETTLDLIYLSEYPKSAVLYAEVEEADEEFASLPAGTLFLFSFFWMTLWNLIPIIIALTSIEKCSYCTALIGPIFFAMIVMELVVGYFVARRERNVSLRNTLYGAQVVGRNHQDAPNTDADTPKQMSYQDFFHEDKHTCFFVLCVIVQDVCYAVGWILFIVYFAVLGGGHCVLYSLVVARWEINLLGRFESETGASRVMGSVVCRQHQYRVIVTCQIQGQWYKKRLNNVPDYPELAYLTDLPTSASLKTRIDNRHEETEQCKMFLAGLILMAFQVGIPVLFVWGDASNTVYIVAGICVGCHLVFGFIGAVIQYQFFFKRALLYGAKKVDIRDTSHDAVLDEGLDIDMGVWLEDAGTEATMSTTDESAASFVNGFMKGKFPLFSKAFLFS